MTDLTTQEQAAIRALKRLAKKWPESLWLYSGSGTLTVMRNLPGGSTAVTPSGGVDPDYAITTVKIPNDGGDW